MVIQRPAAQDRWVSIETLAEDLENSKLLHFQGQQRGGSEAGGSADTVIMYPAGAAKVARSCAD